MFQKCNSYCHVPSNVKAYMLVYDLCACTFTGANRYRPLSCSHIQPGTRHKSMSFLFRSVLSKQNMFCAIHRSVSINTLDACLTDMSASSFACRLESILYTVVCTPYSACYHVFIEKNKHAFLFRWNSTGQKHHFFFKLPCQLSRKKLSGYPQMVDLDSQPSQALQCSYMHDIAIQCKHTPYSAVLSKLGKGRQRYMCACVTGIPRFSHSAWA